MMMFLPFIPSFVFFTHSYFSSKRHISSVAMSMNSGGILLSLISGSVTSGGPVPVTYLSVPQCPMDGDDNHTSLTGLSGLS